MSTTLYCPSQTAVYGNIINVIVDRYIYYGEMPNVPIGQNRVLTKNFPLPIGVKSIRVPVAGDYLVMIKLPNDTKANITITANGCGIVTFDNVNFVQFKEFIPIRFTDVEVRIDFSKEVSHVALSFAVINNMEDLVKLHAAELCQPVIDLHDDLRHNLYLTQRAFFPVKKPLRHCTPT